MAQLAGLVMLDPEDTAAKGLFFFGGIESCRFRKPVVPGDVLVRWGAAETAHCALAVHCDVLMCWGWGLIEGSSWLAAWL